MLKYDFAASSKVMAIGSCERNVHARLDLTEATVLLPFSLPPLQMRVFQNDTLERERRTCGGCD